MKKLCMTILSIMIVPLCCIAHLNSVTSMGAELFGQHSANQFYINMVDNKKGNIGIKYPKAPSKGVLVSIDRDILCIYGDFTNKFLKIEDEKGTIVFLTTISVAKEKIEIPPLSNGKYYMYLYDENIVYGGEFEVY